MDGPSAPSELKTIDASAAAKPGIFVPGQPSLAEWIAARGEPRYRAGQVVSWIVQRRAVQFADMTDLPKSLRESLAAEWEVLTTCVARESIDADGTAKLLLGLADGQTIESVLIPEGTRRTVCMSTQVGCAMGCVFCASGIGGVVRNLRAGEMIEQLLHLQRRLPADERINHVVVMGMGEPLANLDALLEALAFATSAKEGLGIGARQITISTVGLPAKIRRLAELKRQYHLAISLHAPNNEIRQRIVPMAEKIALEEILDAADEFRATTGRQVTFEYVLLGGINDHPDHARQLSALVGRRDAMINLIPYNPVASLGYRTPTPERSRTFAEILERGGHVVKIRKRKGSSINAACGQLRRQHDPTVGIGAAAKK